MLPKPTSPTVLPLIWKQVSRISGVGQPPWRMTRFTYGMRRYTASIRAMASSATGAAFEPAVMASATPWRRTAARSMLSMPMPHFWIMRTLRACSSVPAWTAANPGSRISAGSTSAIWSASSYDAANCNSSSGGAARSTAARTAGAHTSMQATRCLTGGPSCFALRCYAPWERPGGSSQTDQGRASGLSTTPGTTASLGNTVTILPFCHWVVVRLARMFWKSLPNLTP